MEEPLQLSHQQRFASQLFHLNLDISEYAFANLYLFRHLHRYHLVNLFDFPFIKGQTRDHFTYLMPTVPLSTFKTDQLIQLTSYVDFLFPIPEQWLASLNPAIFNVTYQQADSDYLCAASTLKTYPGRHLDGKRNQVKNFISNYNPITYKITKERIADGLKVLDQWSDEQEDHHTDYDSCSEALHLFESLALSGYIIYASDQPIAFSLGEMLNSTTYAIHFIKAIKNFKGIYQYFHQFLAQSLPDSVQWINIEQDLGLPNLRKAKESYHAERLVHKFRVAKQSSSSA